MSSIRLGRARVISMSQPRLSTKIVINLESNHQTSKKYVDLLTDFTKIETTLKRSRDQVNAARVSYHDLAHGCKPLRFSAVAHWAMEGLHSILGYFLYFKYKVWTFPRRLNQLMGITNICKAYKQLRLLVRTPLFDSHLE